MSHLGRLTWLTWLIRSKLLGHMRTRRSLHRHALGHLLHRTLSRRHLMRWITTQGHILRCDLALHRRLSLPWRSLHRLALHWLLHWMTLHRLLHLPLHWLALNLLALHRLTRHRLLHLLLHRPTLHTGILDRNPRLPSRPPALQRLILLRRRILLARRLFRALSKPLCPFIVLALLRLHLRWRCHRVWPCSPLLLRHVGLRHGTGRDHGTTGNILTGWHLSRSLRWGHLTGWPWRRWACLCTTWRSRHHDGRRLRKR